MPRLDDYESVCMPHHHRHFATADAGKTLLTILWLCGQQVLAQMQLALDAPVSWLRIRDWVVETTLHAAACY